MPTRLRPEPRALPAAGPLRYPCSAPPVRTSLCGRRPARGCAARKPGRPRLTQGGLNHSWCLECAGQGGTVRLRPGWRNGRRRGLKIPYRKVCRFESCSGHHVGFPRQPSRTRNPYGSRIKPSVSCPTPSHPRLLQPGAHGGRIGGTSGDTWGHKPPPPIQREGIAWQPAR